MTIFGDGMKQDLTTPSAPCVVEMGALYPELPDPGAPPDQSYRLQEISRLRKNLEDEQESRAQLYKKYLRAVNILDGLDMLAFAICLISGVAGVGPLAIIVAAPVVIGLEIAAMVCGALGAFGKVVARRLTVKARKHDSLRVLAESKLNTISDHVSRALMDGVVDDVEFRIIVDELKKYGQLKAEIKAGARREYAATALDKKTKNSLIQRGRDEARAQFLKNLGAS